jgi:PAS domain S-box-containing protein
MLGYEPNELLGKQVIPLTVAPEARELVKKQVATGGIGPYESIGLRKDGTKFPMEIRAREMEYEGRKTRVAAIMDITERKVAELAGKRAEEALRCERNLLRTLIDNLPDAVYVKDMECRKTVANVADVRYMGQQSEAEVLGKTDFDFYPADAAAAYHADDQSVVQTGQPVLNKEEFLVDKEGKKHFFSTTKLPLRDERGQIIGLVGVGRDITERKRAENALRESEERHRSLVEAVPDVIQRLK